MNRRTFFRNLILGIAAVPAAIKEVGKNRLPYFDGENSYLKTTPFKLEPGTVYFLNGVSGNYASAPDANEVEIAGDLEYTIVMQPARSC